MTWELKEELRRKLAGEKGFVAEKKNFAVRFALCYPNSYFVGMSNLGIHVVYKILNEHDGVSCERFFLPDKNDLVKYERTQTPLMSMETQTELFRFDIVGFAVSFEPDYFNLLKILALGRIKPKADERDDKAPLIIAGGPCATFNPEPLSLFVDAFIVGEGEAIMDAFMDAFVAAQNEKLPRRELLGRLAAVAGVYVPSLYRHFYAADGTLAKIEPLFGAPQRVKRQWPKDLSRYPAHTVIVTDDTEFNMYLVETARGCGRHCRFCMAGYAFRRPRNVSREALFDAIKEAAPYRKRIGLMGAAVSDHPEINALCADILSLSLPMSVASLRADSVSEELVATLAKSGMRTMTIAPEAGSKRMRAVINKGIGERDVFRAMELGIKAGIKNFRLYIMIGLPFENDEDISAVIDLAAAVKNFMDENGGGGKLTLSINSFVPKPFTPFQWAPMAGKKYLEDALKKIRTALKKCRGIEVIAESVKKSLVQGVLARGDRRISRVLLAAHEKGGEKYFRFAMKEAGLDFSFWLNRPRGRDELFAWETLDMGFSREYIYEEFQKAARSEATLKCFDGCRRCGVCQE